MMGLRWGQPGKAGKTRQPEQVPSGGPQGAPSPGNAVAAPGWRYGRNPLAFSYARRLGVASSLTSPSVAGRFRTQDASSPERRGGSPDLGALQSFRGLVGLTGRAKLGMQSGPSAMPGYPSTGQGGLLPQLASMSRPDEQRIGWF